MGSDPKTEAGQPRTPIDLEQHLDAILGDDGELITTGVAKARVRAWLSTTRTGLPRPASSMPREATVTPMSDPARLLSPADREGQVAGVAAALHEAVHDPETDKHWAEGSNCESKP